MTLIAELHRPSQKMSVFLSDCLVFFGEGGVRKMNDFPLHFASNWNIDTFGGDLLSKILTSDDRLILGSGDVERVQAIAEEWFRTKKGDMASFQRFLDSSYFDREQSESFIYNGTNEAGCDYCCDHKNFDDLIVVSAGKGSPYLQELIGYFTPNRDAPLLQIAAELLAMLCRQEFSDYDFKNHYFGSAYEMAFFTSDQGTVRIPYLIIDLMADSIKAPDGIFDISKPRVERVILSIPHRKGSFFVTIGQQKKVFHCKELDVSLTSNEESELLHSAIKRFTPRFTVVLVRHSDVNFRLSNQNPCSIRAAEGSWEIWIDTSLLYRIVTAETNWYVETPS